MPLDGLPCRTNTVGWAGSPAVCTRSVRPVGVVTVSWSVMGATVQAGATLVSYTQGVRSPGSRTQIRCTCALLVSACPSRSIAQAAIRYLCGWS